MPTVRLLDKADSMVFNRTHQSEERVADSTINGGHGGGLKSAAEQSVPGQPVRLLPLDFHEIGGRKLRLGINSVRQTNLARF